MYLGTSAHECTCIFRNNKSAHIPVNETDPVRSVYSGWNNIIYVKIHLEKWPLVAGDEGKETVRDATIPSE